MMFDFLIALHPARRNSWCGKLTQMVRIAKHSAVLVYGILRSSNVALAAGRPERNSPVQSYLLVYPPTE